VNLVFKVSSTVVESPGESNMCTETKLLKTGTSYPLGRKGNPLIIANKKISSLHCEFVVGSYSVADVVRPLVIH
jgi:hypothetical protein